MPGRPLPVLSLAVLSAVGCKTTNAHQGEAIVHRIEIDGAKQVSAGDIKKRIATTQTSWIPFSAKQYFDPDIWRTDLKRIERYYQSKGFYQARVVSDSVEPLSKNRVNVKARVDEGEPTTVRAIHLRGLEDLPPEQQAAIRDALHLVVGQVFVEEDWEHAKGKMKELLENLGYAQAGVHGEAQVDVATHRADLDIELEPGQRYHFGRVDVTQRGPAHVDAWRIKEKAEEEIRPSEWFSNKTMESAQRQVFDLGVFGAVKVRPEAPDEANAVVPVDVAVQEAPFHTLRYGGGIYVDQLRNDARLKADYTDRNFLGGLRRLTLTGMAGWAWLPNIFAGLGKAPGSQSGPVAKLTAELEQRVFSPNLSARVHAELERGIEPAYSYYGGRARLGLVWRPLRSLAILPSYNFEAYRLQGVASLIGNAPPLLFGCPTVCKLSYLEERIEWDKRDNKLEPKNGYYLAMGVQEGGGILGGSFQYLRFEPEARGYVSFGEEQRYTLAARIHVGSLHPLSGTDANSPIVARFFGGGADMRGFNAQRLSPMYIEANPNAQATYTGIAEPIGGDGLFESSLEARWNVWGPVVVAVFTDQGFVTTEHYDLSQWGFIREHMLYAFGTGVRYRTPVGPIRLDFAYRPNIGPPLQVYSADPTLTYQSPKQCFGIGGANGVRAGAPEDPCTIQLSIGEAF